MGRLIICPMCQEEKEHKAKGLCSSCYKRDFHQRNRDKERARKRRWYWEHREERIAYNRRRYWENPGKERARARRWYHQSAEKTKARNRLWKQRNKERLAADFRNWWRSNPDKIAMYHARYSAQKRGLPDTLTEKEIGYKLSVGYCFYCGAEVPLTLDHFVPLSKGGGTTLANTVVACGNCNSSKRDKLPKEILSQLSLMPMKEPV